MKRRAFAVLLGCLACACGDVASVAVTNPMDQEPVDSCPADPSWSQDLPDYPRGLHVEGTQVVDANGNAIALRGVNRSGTEYRCIQGFGLFD